ncbi:unnamed protein product [Rhizoctonia solani]|uniref:Protein kinase domain-containing protein n=1 Tax=Rhizoctonia solani TaxID=456999 RepID=A0A8H3CWX3_9AGAM|nr:unnamed protein product [Rhizoctonia solani]
MSAISTPISGAMPVPQILALFRERGCEDVTMQLDLPNLKSIPTAHGGQGDVYKGKLIDGTEVAIKIIRMKVPSNSDEKNKLRRIAHELYIWTKCKHRNILELIGMAIFHDNLSIISPWIGSGNLSWFISQNPQVDRYAMCAQVAEGIAHMHHYQIVHGDIKCGNILVSQDHTIKIMDFGSSTLKQEYTLKFETSSGHSGYSLRWAAPELLSTESEIEAKPTFETDIYALGMTFLEITSGRVPYGDVGREYNIMIQISQHRLPKRPEDCITTGNAQADSLWLLMQDTWAKAPQDRPKASVVCDRVNAITTNSRPLQGEYETRMEAKQQKNELEKEEEEKMAREGEEKKRKEKGRIEEEKRAKEEEECKAREEAEEECKAREETKRKTEEERKAREEEERKAKEEEYREARENEEAEAATRAEAASKVKEEAGKAKAEAETKEATDEETCDTVPASPIASPKPTNGLLPSTIPDRRPATPEHPLPPSISTLAGKRPKRPKHKDEAKAAVRTRADPKVKEKVEKVKAEVEVKEAADKETAHHPLPSPPRPADPKVKEKVENVKAGAKDKKIANKETRNTVPASPIAPPKSTKSPLPSITLDRQSTLSTSVSATPEHPSPPSISISTSTSEQPNQPKRPVLAKAKKPTDKEARDTVPASPIASPKPADSPLPSTIPDRPSPLSVSITDTPERPSPPSTSTSTSERPKRPKHKDGAKAAVRTEADPTVKEKLEKVKAEAEAKKATNKETRDTVPTSPIAPPKPTNSPLPSSPSRRSPLPISVTATPKRPSLPSISISTSTSEQSSQPKHNDKAKATVRTEADPKVKEKRKGGAEAEAKKAADKETRDTVPASPIAPPKPTKSPLPRSVTATPERPSPPSTSTSTSTNERPKRPKHPVSGPFIEDLDAISCVATIGARSSTNRLRDTTPPDLHPESAGQNARSVRERIEVTQEVSPVFSRPFRVGRGSQFKDQLNTWCDRVQVGHIGFITHQTYYCDEDGHALYQAVPFFPSVTDVSDSYAAQGHSQSEARGNSLSMLLEARLSVNPDTIEFVYHPGSPGLVIAQPECHINITVVSYGAFESPTDQHVVGWGTNERGAEEDAAQRLLTSGRYCFY